jgi:pimeloyl-ACP methyl ester carboxylesterase
VPTLLVAGERETKAAQRSAVIAADLMPQGTAVTAGGVNHGWSAEAPAFFNAAILAWFAGGTVHEGLRFA